MSKVTPGKDEEQVNKSESKYPAKKGKAARDRSIDRKKQEFNSTLSLDRGRMQVEEGNSGIIRNGTRE